MAGAPGAVDRLRPPADEAAVGMSAYLTATPGVGGRLRTEAEDFQVVELGDGPPARDGPYAAARIRLRNWETNRFASMAARELRIRPGHVSFGGMKDKRAVTEQWFTFRCPPERLVALGRLQDVQIIGTPYATTERQYTGAHEGNRFVLRVRGHHADPDAVEATAAAIRAEGGVPNYFGPQRFGGGVRAITHLVGRAIVEGDLEEAVRLFVGHPFPGERDDTRAARGLYEGTRDAEAALQAFPGALDPERQVLARLAKHPGDWRHALGALPRNLLQLFVHADQSLWFNRIVSARIDAGLGLSRAHEGDRVLAAGDDGTATVVVDASNRDRVQHELDRGRAFLTAPLVGTDVPLAHGAPGEVEARVLADGRVDASSYRCRELPAVASEGRRRALLQPVHDLDVSWLDGDPVFAFALGRGAYATVVLREFQKGQAPA